MAAKPLKYWAFISYSHRDAAAATAVQRAIEAYRVPKRLVGRPTPMGDVPPCFKPVFRDRDELQAGADLKATVRDAIERSRYLIVVCSPAAAGSPWVEREIIEFKSLHGESRVLALIVDGEPFATAMPGRAAEECFPQAMRFALTPDGFPRGEPLEPIAADLRPQGDSKRLAILKLIAGMLGEGVGVDELVRRDLQRRLRRMGMAVAASIAGMAVMGVLTIVAIHARGEAQSQRAQAEGLIEFMLGDLRTKLEPVGRLDVLDAVGEKVIGYYALQDSQRLDANSLGRRSRALHLIGELRDKGGHLDQALAAFESAAVTTGQLLARDADDGQRVFDHAQSVYWVGYIAWRRGQAEQAEPAFLEYRTLARRLVRIDPTNVDWQLEVAYANQNLGVVQLDRLQLADALNSFSETRQIFEDLVAVRPMLAGSVAETSGWIAKVDEAAGDYDAAIVAQKARLALVTAAPDADKNKDLQHQIVNVNFELGRLNLYRGDLAIAEHHARIALQGADAMVASDRANMFWLAEASFERLRVAEIEWANGIRDAARANVDQVIKDSRRLIASDASVMNWQVNLQGLALMLRTRIALAEGNDAPIDELQGVIQTAQTFESTGKVLGPYRNEIVAGVELALGDALAHDDKRARAEDHWQAVVARLGPVAATANNPSLTLLARADLRLGKIQEAQALTARVQASNYRHPAYADLVSELRPGAGPAHANNTGNENVQGRQRHDQHRQPDQRFDRSAADGTRQQSTDPVGHPD